MTFAIRRGYCSAEILDGPHGYRILGDEVKIIEVRWEFKIKMFEIIWLEKVA